MSNIPNYCYKIYSLKTLQEFRMLSLVALYWRVTLNVEIVVLKCQKCYRRCLNIAMITSMGVLRTLSSKCLRLVVGQVLLITLIKRVKGGLTTDKSLTVVYMSVFQQWRVANEWVKRSPIEQSWELIRKGSIWNCKMLCASVKGTNLGPIYPVSNHIFLGKHWLFNFS